MRHKLYKFLTRIASILAAHLSDIKNFLKYNLLPSFAEEYKLLKEIDAIKRIKPNGPCVVTFLSKEFYIQNKETFLQCFSEIFTKQNYCFPAENDAPYIIDCGCNIGLSIIFFKNIYPKAKIVGFEPDQAAFELLKKNSSSYFAENVELINKAVWHENTLLPFQSEETLGSKIKLDSACNNKSEIFVEGVDLRVYLNKKVDFLKIDIEGAEYDLIKKIQSNLTYVHFLFIEYHCYSKQKQHLDQLLRLITDAGFRYYIKEAWSPKNPFLYFGTSKDERTFDLQLDIFAINENI